MNTPAAAPAAVSLARPPVAADGPRRGHLHRHVHDHDHDHDHAAPAGGHDHGAVQVRPVGPLAPSLLRASLGVRLAIAGGFSALIWIAVAWARLPIAG